MLRNTKSGRAYDPNDGTACKKCRGGRIRSPKLLREMREMNSSNKQSFDQMLTSFLAQQAKREQEQEQGRVEFQRYKKALLREVKGLIVSDEKINDFRKQELTPEEAAKKVRHVGDCGHDAKVPSQTKRGRKQEDGYVAFIATMDTSDSRVSKFLRGQLEASKTLDTEDRKSEYYVLLAFMEITNRVCKCLHGDEITHHWGEIEIPPNFILNEVNGKGFSLSSSECQQIIGRLSVLGLVEGVGIEVLGLRFRLADKLIHDLQVFIAWPDSSESQGGPA